MIIKLITLATLLLYILSTVSFAQDTTKIKIRRTEPADFLVPVDNTPPPSIDTTGVGIWTELNPKIPRTHYIGLDFINADTGWACGQNGTIIKTTNGGDDWTTSSTDVTTLLLKIHSFNGSVVIATGWDGIILRSDDGGMNFTSIDNPSGATNDLWGVKMINDTLGWVCGMGATLLKTTDAGLTWNKVTPGLNAHYWSLDFYDELFGLVVCADGKILKTTDGGESWSTKDINDDRDLLTVDIIDSTHIAAAGVFGHVFPQQGGVFIYSTDAGETWEIKPEINTGEDANVIDFIDRNTGYSINGLSSGIRKTTDRGDTWFNPTTANIDAEWHIQLLEDGAGYICGNETKLYKKDIFSENWKRLLHIYQLKDVHFFNENEGFIRNGGLYKTTDGGITLTQVPNAPGGGHLLFINDQVGFIGARYKTTDRGETWDTTNYVGGTNKLFFLNDRLGWAASNGIYKTTDGGDSWLLQDSSTQLNSFGGIHFTDSLNGWATSRYVWNTTDGGINWSERRDIQIFLCKDVLFISNEQGFIIESDNRIFETKDNGNSWNEILNIPEIGIHRFSNVINNTIFIFGRSSYRSLDAGNSWEEFSEIRGNNLRALFLINPGLGYAVGDNGLILKYFDEGIVPVELMLFNGIVKKQSVTLTWFTATESNNNGFFIQRINTGESKWHNIAFIEGYGTTTEKQHYSFIDKDLPIGKYKYRLKQIDYDGSYEYSKEIDVSITPSFSYALSQNYPNPFNPSTVIEYQIPQVNLVKISIFNLLGEKVETLVNEVKEPGIYKADFNGSDLSSGIYFYQITSGEFSETKKMLLIK